MPRPEVLGQLRVHGQRQKARRRGDAIVPHDHGTVVERRHRLEDAQEQIVRQRPIDRNAAFDVVPQPDLPLDGDDRADALRRQHARRDHQLFYGFFGRLRLRKVSEERRAAKMREGAPDVRLKEDNHGKYDVAHHVPDEPVDGFETSPARSIEQRDDDAAAERHLDRARPADQLQHLVHEDPDDEDVDEIPPTDRGTAKERRDPGHVTVRARHQVCGVG